MDEFYAKYGVKHKADLLERVKSDPILAMAVIDELLEEKFPTAIPVVEAAVEVHDFNPEAPTQ
jgi:hypothetical protein